MHRSSLLTLHVALWQGSAMLRALRIEFEGAIYHVLNHGDIKKGRFIAEGSFSGAGTVARSANITLTKYSRELATRPLKFYPDDGTHVHPTRWEGKTPVVFYRIFTIARDTQRIWSAIIKRSSRMKIPVDWVPVPGVGHDTKGLYQRVGLESLRFMEKGMNQQKQFRR